MFKVTPAPKNRGHLAYAVENRGPKPIYYITNRIPDEKRERVCVFFKPNIYLNLWTIIIIHPFNGSTINVITDLQHEYEIPYS